MAAASLQCRQRHFPALYPLIVLCRYWRPTAFGLVKPRAAGSGTARRRSVGDSEAGMANTRSSSPRPAFAMYAVILRVSCLLSLRQRYSPSLGYSLTRNRWPEGWNFGSTWTTV